MRKTILTACLFSSLYATAFCQIQDSTYAKWLLTPEIKRGFDYALSAAKLTYKDFTFRTDYWETDSARLYPINTLMTAPLGLPFKCLSMARKVESANLFAIFEAQLLPFGGLPWGGYDLDNGNTPDSLGRQEKDEFSKISRRFPSESEVQNLETLKLVLSNLLETTKRQLMMYDHDKNQIHFIQKKFPRVVLEDISDESLSVDQLDSVQNLEEQITKEFLHQNFFNNYYLIKNSLWEVLQTCSNAVKALKTAHSTSKKAILWEDKKLKAIIGGTGPNHYKGDYALIIDLGGDDTYELSRRPNFENQIIIDLGGNDKYYALEDYALACGNFGYSVLIDVAGDDLYQGKNFSLGCGFFGCGLLWDQAGNDTYIGDQFTEGAGGFGIGILKDDGGNDHYIAARAAQGFGFVHGVGALLDGSGNDTYFAGGKYKESIGLSGEIRYLSEAQGYATGLRPYLSGGMGFLFDYEGDDSYSVDMNGQGASYWWALGALVDFKGNDRYVAQQYAQGAGVHMSLGCLVDSSGNDFYYSKGVSQGCGHDLGAGMLFDLSGDDNYVATSGSQAFGSGNGIGILVDGGGNDGYYVKEKKNTQGVGDPRREYGSIAVFLDCSGVDHYDGNGGENRIWKPTGTMWGVGVDGEFGTPDSTQVKK